MTVLCLAELDGDQVTDASVRALAFARRLADSAGEQLSVAIFSKETAGEPTVALASRYGAADLYVVTAGERYAPVARARALAGLIEQSGASAVIAAGTDHGAEVMAHLGVLTGLDLAANCQSASWGPAGECQLVRYRWAGSLLEDAVLDARPALLTVVTDAPAGSEKSGPAPTVHHVEPELGEADLLVQATESAVSGSGVSLATARVVIGGGRGVGGPEGFAPLEELAELLGGALGVSRVVTSQGWRPHRQQVGQTGTKIAPELYLACGISGAIQHLAGCQAAKHVVAVNTDPEAPIIARADYAVIGDLSKVIPALVSALRERGR
jgi:electron transfer flavoprotein alpha subunit